MNNRISFILSLALFMISFLVGLIILTLDPVIYTDDGLTIYLEAKNIIAHFGLPYYKWWHTPLYNYLVAAIIIIFRDNMFFLRLVQILITSTTTVVIFATISLKKERNVAILASVLYTTSYVVLMSTFQVHAENLTSFFIAFCFYFFFRYEKERKSFWIWAASFTLGLAFFTKEQSIVVMGIYVVYVVFWIKPKMRDLLICACILSIFLGAFLIVQYLQDWFIIKTYLGIGGEGNDTFLSRTGILEIDKLLNAFSVDLIIFLLGFVYILILTIQFIKKRKIRTEEVFAVSILIYTMIFMISRGGIIHFSYVLFELVFIASLGFFDIYDRLKMSIKKLSQISERNKNRSIAFLLLPLLCIHIFLFIPNVIVIRNLYHEKLVIYQDIGRIVENNITYSENPDALGLFITNYYSPYSWYNAYERNDFVWWNPNDVFRLQNMQNITDRGIIYFVYENLTNNNFFDEIAINGTLTVVETYTYRSQTIWWIPATESTIILYKI